MVLEKCKKCKYKDRNKKVFPCDKCLEKELIESPITCDDCRIGFIRPCKKGIRPCENFKWS